LAAEVAVAALLLPSPVVSGAAVLLSALLLAEALAGVVEEVVLLAWLFC
jgi:hypothetical protein